jgi:hypothetical protein
MHCLFIPFWSLNIGHLPMSSLALPPHVWGPHAKKKKIENFVTHFLVFTGDCRLSFLGEGFSFLYTRFFPLTRVLHSFSWSRCEFSLSKAIYVSRLEFLLNNELRLRSAWLTSRILSCHLDGPRNFETGLAGSPFL